jgi:hypothetical protein
MRKQWETHIACGLLLLCAFVPGEFVTSALIRLNWVVMDKLPLAADNRFGWAS